MVVGWKNRKNGVKRRDRRLREEEGKEEEEQTQTKREREITLVVLAGEVGEPPMT